MRHHFLTSLTIAALLLTPQSIATAETVHPTLPAVVSWRGSAAIEPLWVDAASAVDVRGNVRPEIFVESWRDLNETFAHRRTAPSLALEVEQLPDSSHCRGIVGEIIGAASSHEPSTLESLVDQSIGIYVGEVTLVRPGFLSATPASLITADRLLTLRDYETRDRGGPLQLAHTYARFAVGSIVACSGFRPLVEGNRFIAVVHRLPLDAEGSLLIPNEIFIETDDGGISADGAWKAEITANLGARATFDDLLRLIVTLEKAAEANVEH